MWKGKEEELWKTNGGNYLIQLDYVSPEGHFGCLEDDKYWLYFVRTEGPENAVAELLIFCSYDTTKKSGLLLCMERVFL